MSSDRHPTPQQRALAKKLALWTADGDNSDPDFGSLSYFDPLSDDEWSQVWVHALAAGAQPADEGRLRAMVDRAAISSGYFADYGTVDDSNVPFRETAKEYAAIAAKVSDFRNEIAKLFVEPSNPGDDMWSGYRHLLSDLDRLAARLKRQGESAKQKVAAVSTRTPNAAKPKLDLWRGGLVVAWSSCGLAIKNSKELRGFLLAALGPYSVGATDRAARAFIVRYLRGGVS